jgi:hypothetical protein
MRRALASFLLAVLSFPLIAPILCANPGSNLPPCCRRDGKHRCAMAMAAMETESSSGPAFRAVQARCPYYPATAPIPSERNAALLKDASAIFTSLLSHPAVQVSGETRCRVSFSRSHQKRGPPPPLS